MGVTNINLGCGPVFVASPKWINLDFCTESPSVRQANFLDRLPLPSNEARLVYSLQFPEHVLKSDVDTFLRESVDNDRADFIVIEMIDQCVRHESSRELGRFYNRLLSANGNQGGMVVFTRERTGEDLSAKSTYHSIIGELSTRLLSPRRLAQRVRHGRQRIWLRSSPAGLLAAFSTRNVSLVSVGKRRHWLWDFHKLKRALESTGFVEVQRRTADSSALMDFPFPLPLYLDAEDRPRKGLLRREGQ